ncbi:MAG: acyl-CoA dehydrogenase family protein [Myxococcota bacterium]|nr:acyl-CoA dehydrogenase family protein [Myxococcota bacterium]
MDFAVSARAQALLDRIKAFMATHITPVEADLLQRQRAQPDIWIELPEIRTLKDKAREDGLWNLFLPEVSGLTNVEYATLAEQMGRSFIAPEIFNCNAPDTGNMEVLEKYGTPQQKSRWLEPLLDGRIRSAFCMTEPQVASSDATNMEATAVVDGDEIVINGRKWWSTGIGHPDCQVLIFMGLTEPEAHRHERHSMVLVPRDTPGVRIERMLTVFGDHDPPYGHGEVSFTNVRVPIENFILGPGRGFEIAQGRLGPGRIHHCMRLIGAAEVALELLIERAISRVAFGKPLSSLGGNRDIIANARMDIDMARLLTLKAAWLIDTVGVFGAMKEISAIKVVAPNIALRIIDEAMQIHGGAGLSADFPLAAMYASARILRLADGPDEVHRGLVARWELLPHKDRIAPSRPRR